MDISPTPLTQEKSAPSKSVCLQIVCIFPPIRGLFGEILPQCVCVCQKDTYELSLTNISQYNLPISFPAQQCPPYPNLDSPLPIHISKLLTSPVLIHPLHPMLSLFPYGACHHVAPAPDIWSPAPGSGRDGLVHTRMFPIIPCTICTTGQQQVD